MTTFRSVSLPVIAAGSVCGAFYFYLSRVSHSYGAASFADVALVYGGAGVVTALLVVWMHFSGARFAAAGDYRSGMLWVLAFALVFRLLGVLTFPVLEDDFYRYLWDGRMFVHSGSPYGIAPADFFASTDLSERFETILDGINYPGVATVYGPTLQLAFGLGYLISPGAVWPLQCLFGLADVLVLLILLKFVTPDSRASLLCWLLYAWSPLLIKEFATTAHPDILGALLVLLAFLLHQKPDTNASTDNWPRRMVIGFLLALAVGVKPFALVIAPFLIGLRLQAMTGFALGILLVTLPFTGVALVTDSALGVWLPEGLQTMGQDWFFNAGFYELAYWLGVQDLALLKRIALGAFAVIWLLIWGRTMVADRTQRSQASVPVASLAASLARLIVVLFGLFLLVVPALNPWYLAWWLPFAVIRPCITPWVASFAVLLSYLSGINVSSGTALDSFGALYTVPGWVLAIEFGSIGLALIIDLRLIYSSKIAD